VTGHVSRVRLSETGSGVIIDVQTVVSFKPPGSVS